LREVIGKCPVCNEGLVITKLSCPNCHTQIEGKFTLCKFCYLTQDQKNFLEAFVKCRGNLKELEKELNISYPTIKSRLENLRSALGFREETDFADENYIDSREVLEKLSKGEISVEEAKKLLRKIKQ